MSHIQYMCCTNINHRIIIVDSVILNDCCYLWLDREQSRARPARWAAGRRAWAWRRRWTTRPRSAARSPGWRTGRSRTLGWTQWCGYSPVIKHNHRNHASSVKVTKTFANDTNILSLMHPCFESSSQHHYARYRQLKIYNSPPHTLYLHAWAKRRQVERSANIQHTVNANCNSFWLQHFCFGI